MPKRILIDASHSEETRVVTLENGRVQEFDSETTIKQQIKGNIYLAKVTRVEPSLQAAFVEYGGSRHGFLPFSEIHPDYYNIPVSDKQKLLDSLRNQENVAEEEFEEQEEIPAVANTDSQEGNSDETTSDETEESAEELEKEISKGEVDILSGEDDEVEKPTSRISQNLHRLYKIQEVIKHNQIILVQVEKEERGNKGASLTTFISLAGKYCVLMPNALRKGGVSRRIASYEDRKRLKKILAGFDLPKETGLIVRTAGAKRAEDDIKRDYNYLVGLWNSIREKTLSSAAPSFIHAEEDLVKRIVRDSFDDSIDEMLIAGGGAYNSAKEFIDILMPNYAQRIKRYKNKVPIFTRYRIDEQIASFYEEEAPLQSGGSIVINPTEALISIDVNSGRSTTKRSVEETALATNLEAAYEVARQLRLRDLSGLIVIDFIDMLEIKNRKAVERAVKEAFSNDKARIQIGRISTFGLLEMSRQRLRSNFFEVNTMPCPHCNGTGFVKASETIAVSVLRGIESEISRNKIAVGAQIEVYVAPEIATYILNHKRDKVEKLEKQFEISLLFYPDTTIAPEAFSISNLPKQHGSNHQHQAKQSSNNSATAAQLKPIPQAGNANEKKQKPSKSKKVSMGSILDGLWKKIVD